jgi:hypothetical protein
VVPKSRKLRILVPRATYACMPRCINTGKRLSFTHMKMALFRVLLQGMEVRFDIWESRGIAHPFLTSALDSGEWSVSRPERFTPGEKSPRYPLDRGLGEPQSQSGRYGEEKNLAPAGNRTPAVQSVARLCTDWGIRTLPT